MATFYKEPKKPITGSSEDDRILVDKPANLTSTDTIDGAGGTDTLRINAKTIGSFVLPRATSNIEVVEISESATDLSTTTSGANFMGNKAINLDASVVFSPLTIRGNQGNNAITGGSGNDTIRGFAGNDIINGGPGVDQLAGDEGDDIFVFGESALQDSIEGGDGNDMLLYSGTPGSTYIVDESVLTDQLSSVEILAVGTIKANKLDTKDITALNFNAGAISDKFNLTLQGNAGPNQLIGGAGNDTLNGGGGKDTLNGGSGDDETVFSQGTDLVTGTVIDGGAHTIADTVRFTGKGVFKLAGVTFTGIEQFVIDDSSAASFDFTGYTGSAFTLIGGSGNNNVTGQNTVDETFIGGGGTDKLDGGKTVLTTTGGITVDGLKTYTAPSGTFANVSVGDWVAFSGFTNSANNGLRKVDSKTATTLTVLSDFATVAESGGTTAVAAGRKFSTIKQTSSDDTFVFLHADDAAQIDGGASSAVPGGKLSLKDAGTDVMIFNETEVSSSLVYNTLVLNASKIKNIEKVILWSESVVDYDYTTAKAATGATGTGGTLSLNIDGSKLIDDITLIGNSGLNILAGGKGIDTLTGGDGSDVFVYDVGSTGNLGTLPQDDPATGTLALPVIEKWVTDYTATYFDAHLETITDWDAATSENDVIDYKKALTLSTAVATPPTATSKIIPVASAATKFATVDVVGATIDATGKATIPATPATITLTLAPAIGGLTAGAKTGLYWEAASVAVALDAVTKTTAPANDGDGPIAGEVAYWKTGSDTYVFISDGKAGSAATPFTAGDVIIKVANFDGTAAGLARINSDGNLMFTADASVVNAPAAGTVLLTTDNDTVSAALTSASDAIEGRTLDALNSGDSIVDGYTSDNDTLNALIGKDVAATITKIETINITDQFGGSTLNAAGITFAKQITLDAATPASAITIDNVDGSKITTIKAGDNISDLTVSNLKTNPTLLQNKASTINLDGAAAGTLSTTIKLSGAPLALVDGGDPLTGTLSLVSTSTPSTVTLGTGVVNNAGGKLAISGTGTVTLTAGAADLDIGKISEIKDTLSGSAQFVVDLNALATSDLSGITTADKFVISATTPLDTGVLTFKNGITNLELNSNVLNSTGGFIGAGASDVLNLKVNVANTNLVTSSGATTATNFETVNLTNATGAPLSTNLSNFGTGAVKIISPQDVALGEASFKSLDATSVVGNFAVTGKSGLSGTTTIKSNNNPAVIDLSLTASNNTITTGPKDDLINVGSGADVVLAGDGNDNVGVPANAWTVADNFQGGNGTDTLYLLGTTGAASNLTAGGSKFVGFESIVVSDAVASGVILPQLANASVKGAFGFAAVNANSVSIGFDGSLDTDALFTLDVKSTAITGNTLKTGALSDTIHFDGGKNLANSGGIAVITGGKSADSITLSNTGVGSKIVLANGDTGSVGTPTSTLSVSNMDVINGLQDGDQLDLTAIVASTVYTVQLPAVGNVFTSMPASLANNSVYQVQGTYSPSTRSFTANTTGVDSVFLYDADATVNTVFQAVVAAGYSKDSTQGWAKGIWTLGSTGVLLTTGTDDFDQTTGARKTELTADNNIIDGSVLDTLNSADDIDDPSVTDHDVLNAQVSVNITPVINQVEQVNITVTTAGRTITTSSITKAEQVLIDGASGISSVTVDNITGGSANITRLKAGDNITNLTVTNVTGTGATTPIIVQNNVSTLSLSGSAATEAATVELSAAPLILAAGATDLLTLNLSSTTNSTVTLPTGLVTGTGSSLNIQGSGTITLKAAAADLNKTGNKLDSVTKTLTNGGKFYVDLTTVGAAADLSAVAADGFTISSTAALTGALTFGTGTTNLTLTKNVVTGAVGFIATASAGDEILNLTQTVANTNLITTNYETINLINSTNSALTIATTNVGTGTLNIKSLYNVTLSTNATFGKLDATEMTGPAKLSVTWGGGTDGAATVIGNANDNFIDMSTNSSANTITTLGGNDSLKGGAGDDLFTAGAGNDIIDTGNGNNTVNGGDGNDTITLGTGNDSVLAGNGNDTVFVAVGSWTTADTLNGGGGSDALTLTGTAGGSVSTTATGFTGFENIVVNGIQGTALSVTLADGSVDSALAFTANLANTAQIVFDASADTDAVFNVDIASTDTTNEIKTGALRDTIKFDGSTGSAGQVAITAGKGGDSITLTNTLAAGGSTLNITGQGDSGVLAVTNISTSAVTVNTVTTDIITGLNQAGDKIDLSDLIGSANYYFQGSQTPTATVPVGLADNMIYAVKGDYVAGTFTYAASPGATTAATLLVYDADPTNGSSSFEAIVLTGYSATLADTDFGAGVITLA